MTRVTTHILDAKQARSCIVTAVEGGINYWAFDIEYDKAVPMTLGQNNYEAWMANINGITFKDGEGAMEGKTFKVSAEDVRKAADRIIHEHLIRGDLAAGIINDDIDADAADCIIQVAAFGKLVYG